MTHLLAFAAGAALGTLGGTALGWVIRRRAEDRYHIDRFTAGWNAAIASQLMAREPRYLGVDDDEGAYDGTRTMA